MTAPSSYSSFVPRATRPYSTVLLGALCCWPGVALAHHPMNGELPATFAQGMLSGLAHPVIGLDHLSMLLLVGAYCGVLRQGLGPLVAFIAAGIVGCLIHVARLDVPHAGASLAISLVLAGIAACTVLRASRAVTAAALFLAGCLHGYAYGEAIVGTEPTPLVAYLLGLAAVQVALTIGAWQLARPRGTETNGEVSRLLFVRVTGAATLVIGTLALL